VHYVSQNVQFECKSLALQQSATRTSCLVGTRLLWMTSRSRFGFRKNEAATLEHWIRRVVMAVSTAKITPLFFNIRRLQHRAKAGWKCTIDRAESNRGRSKDKVINEQ
jgi:hypothetical protein